MKIAAIITGLAIFDLFLVLLVMYLDKVVIAEVRRYLRRIRRPKDTGSNIDEQQRNSMVPVRQFRETSMRRYFRYSPWDNRYILEYDAIHPATIDRLRWDGWTITLEIDTAGNLLYAVKGRRIITKTQLP